MNARRNLIILGLLVFSLVGVFIVYARPGFGPGRYHHDFGREGFPFGVLRELDLTEQQKTQIESILKAHRDTVSPLKKEMQAVHSSITAKLLGSTSVNANDFAAESERAAQLHTQLFPTRIALGLEIRNVLTESQRARAAEIIAEKQARRAERKRSWEEQQ